MSTIKTKNIQQKVISGTTQPLKIGGIASDFSDAKISIDTSGNLTASNLTATLNGLLTTNGQIKFPATQNPSSDANTLDDYEEGEWTPVLRGSSTAGVGTYSRQIGRYTKIGNRIFFNIHLNWSAHTGSGAMRITLPQVSVYISENYNTVAVWANNITKTSPSNFQAVIPPGDAFIDIYIYTTTNDAVNLDTSGQFMLSGHYEV